MRKTKVSKVIDNKINDWISSITDIELARDLKDNIIVTGGCIVSLINNETPNDFVIKVGYVNHAEKSDIFHPL